MAIIPQKYIDAATLIGDGTNWYATGFFVGVDEGLDSQGNSHYTTYLVTNKHVVQGQKAICVQYNVNNGTLKQQIQLEANGNRLYSEHSVPGVDIVAIGIDFLPAIQNGAFFNIFVLDKDTLSLADMRKTGVCEGSFAYSIGFPIGISGALASNALKAPVCRMGCISKIEHLYHQTADHAYLIDCSVYPGNSGGPIINRPEFITLANTPVNHGSKLIGIVSGYLPYEDMLISRQTGKNMMITDENSGLATVFSVDRIKEAILLERERQTGLGPNQAMKLP